MRITELFDRGEFVVTAEVGPPKGIHVEHLVEEAKEYLSGITAVNVTDNQSSVMRLGSLATCKALKDAGLTPIFQLTCRDRNRIALQSDLLSAAMLGIDNVLCLTGDHTKMGDHPGAKPVFDLDSVSLLHTIGQLEKGVDLGGNELVGEPPKFAKGAVVSPCSDSVDAQLAKMERKVMAGAVYFQTQAVYEPEKFAEFMEKAKDADGFIFGSAVHYAAPSGTICAVLDRAFYAGSGNFRYKPGAAILSCRRAGSTAAFDVLNKYFTISSMPVVSSGYWNMVHGAKAEDVLKDEEGLQIMRTLGKNMAWLLKCIENGKEKGIERPVSEPKIRTNFIR